jgi:hypothetical protein
MVETLPERGYRFIPEVKRVTGAPITDSKSQDSVEDRSSIEPQRQIKRSAARLVGIIGMIVATVVAVGYFVRWNSSRPATPPVRAMIAVLPFENLSGDTEQDYFSDGMTEEMIARLGRLKPSALGVIARTSVMGYKGGNKDIARIGHELGVEFIVEAAFGASRTEFASRLN